MARPVRPPEVRERAVALRAEGLTYEQIAERLRAEFEGEARISKDAVAALIRRRPNEPAEPAEPQGLSPRTVRYVHTILHAALKDALRWNLVVRNVADAATPPSAAAARSHRPKAWTAEQLRTFLDYVSDSQYLPAWIFLATSGCRWGECLGLRWSDVDLDEATAIISRQVTALDHRVIVKELPKTKQGHLIRLDSGTVSMLRKLRAEQAELKLRSAMRTTTRATYSASPTGSRTTQSASHASSTATSTTSAGTVSISRSRAFRSMASATRGPRSR